MKIYLIILIGLVMIGSVVAYTFDNPEGDLSSKIENLKIKDLKIIEVDCPLNYNDEYNRCFDLQGDINDSLISINTKVCDSYQYKEIQTTMPKEVMINGIQRTIRIPIIRRINTGFCNYRILSDNEVLHIVNKALNKKIEDLSKDKNVKSNKDHKYSDIVIADGGLS